MSAVRDLAPEPSPTVRAPGAGARLHVVGLRHGYGRGASAVPVLRGLDLELEGGAHVALTGPSGSGKSTLLGLLGGLERPQAGTLEVDGRDLARLQGNALARHRRETVGFVFQHFGLVDVLTAKENVALALCLAGVPRRRRAEGAAELLEAVGLSHRADHRPAALSGGEKQRVAIARALANRPRLLLADEPTGNLDEASSERILVLLEELRDRTGSTLVVVTHDRRVADRADRRLRLSEGRLLP